MPTIRAAVIDFLVRHGRNPSMRIRAMPTVHDRAWDHPDGGSRRVAIPPCGSGQCRRSSPRLPLTRCSRSQSLHADQGNADHEPPRHAGRADHRRNPSMRIRAMPTTCSPTRNTHSTASRSQSLHADQGNADTPAWLRPSPRRRKVAIPPCGSGQCRRALTIGRLRKHGLKSRNPSMRIRAMPTSKTRLASTAVPRKVAIPPCGSGQCRRRRGQVGGGGVVVLVAIPPCGSGQCRLKRPPYRATWYHTEVAIPPC